MRKYSNVSIVEFRDNYSKELIDEDLVARKVADLSKEWSFVSFDGVKARICLDEKPLISTDRDMSEIERSKKANVLISSIKQLFDKPGIKSVSSSYEFEGSLSHGINTPKITVWL
jgi:hypothetical protein